MRRKGEMAPPLATSSLSVSKSLRALQAGGLGEVVCGFVTESNRHLIQAIRTMTMARTQAGRMVMQIPLLERTRISALAGGVAGGFVSATLHPIDTVKTKLQTRGASEVYSGPLDVVTKVIYLPPSIYFLLFSACMHCYSSTFLVLQVMDGVCAKCSSSILLFNLYFSV
jgi:hypothetical protein